MDKSDISLVHKVKSKCIVYIITCEGDSEYDRYYYIGSTQDGETRMIAQGGVLGLDAQAKFLQAHPPIDVSCKICSNPEEMYTTEVLNWNLPSSRLGNLDQVRGGRWNQVEKSKFKPKNWPRSRPPTPDTPETPGSPIAAPFVGEEDPKGKIGLAAYY